MSTIHHIWSETIKAASGRGLTLTLWSNRYGYGFRVTDSVSPGLLEATNLTRAQLVDAAPRVLAVIR